MSDTVIRVENLGKRYLLKHQQQGRSRYVALRDVIADGVKSMRQRLLKLKRYQFPSNQEEFWALKDISFEIRRGEVVGIIGRNGAGKSTLLKLLSRITEPTIGRITLRGRVASLLEVGTGFHPELTGRENIFLNGAILGMTKTEIRHNFDQIIAFAEVEKFLDTPVKHYSSGMYVRLAFAVAAYLESEILVVDEVLAVGDVQFQKKCLGKMESVAKTEGRTVLLVSHNMGTITNFCSKGIYLNQGKLISLGEINKVVEEYLGSDVGNLTSKQLYTPDQIKRLNKAIFFHEVTILNHENEKSTEIDVRHHFFIHVVYEVRTSIKNVELSVRISSDDGRPILTTHQSDCSPEQIFLRKPGIYQISIRFPGMFLMPGLYMVTLGAHEPMVQVYDFHENTITFRIHETGTKLAKYQHHKSSGVVLLDLPWVENPV